MHVRAWVAGGGGKREHSALQTLPGPTGIFPFLMSVCARVDFDFVMEC
jgi:hypothetical protein